MSNINISLLESQLKKLNLEIEELKKPILKQKMFYSSILPSIFGLLALSSAWVFGAFDSKIKEFNLDVEQNKITLERQSLDKDKTSHAANVNKNNISQTKIDKNNENADNLRKQNEMLDSEISSKRSELSKLVEELSEYQIEAQDRSLLIEGSEKKISELIARIGVLEKTKEVCNVALLQKENENGALKDGQEALLADISSLKKEAARTRVEQAVASNIIYDGGYYSGVVYLGDGIKDKKKKSMADVFDIKEKEILALIDTTFGGSAKSGFAFTNDAMYFSDGDTKGKLAYSDYSENNVITEKFGTIIIDGKKLALLVAT